MLGTFWRTQRVHAHARGSEVHSSTCGGYVAGAARRCVEVEYRDCVFADRAVSRVGKTVHGTQGAARAYGTWSHEKAVGEFRTAVGARGAHGFRRAARRC